MNRNELMNKIMVVVEKEGKAGIVIKELFKKMKPKIKGRHEFDLAVDELMQTGMLFEKKSKLTSAAKLGLRAALITRVNKTFGFAKTIESETEYFIPGKFLMGSLPNDTVLLKDIKARGTSPEGEVVQLCAYGKGEFTGKLIQMGANFYVQPDTLVKTPVLIKSGKTSGANVGDKVLAKIVQRGKHHADHKAEILSAYGDADTAFSCAKAVLEVNGVSPDFPSVVLDRAAYLEKRGIKSKDYLDREDYRNDMIFTIDSADSKDLDDAISLDKLDDGYLLGVHIADVSHYVPYKSEIDQEAFFRGTSIYYANKVIPMLPAALSNGICSLHPNEDRLTLSALISLDANGNLIDFDFKKSVINSKVKGVYVEINDLLSNNADQRIEEKYSLIRDKIFLMKELADILTRNKKERGAPEIVTHESKIIVDENEVAVDIKPRISGASETMIEEFMLLANEAAAMAGKMKEVPYVYRVHEPPSAEKLEKLNATLKLLGLRSRDLSPNVKPKALSEILAKAKGLPIYSIVNMQVLRSMSKAKYSEFPLGHYGLALENYAHFTSPIRRYPDLIVHRVLSEILDGEQLGAIRKKYTKYAVRAAKQSSQAELNAMKIERECEDCYKAEYMKAHIGETYEAMISSAAKHGLYVELENTVEGLLRVEDLPGGEYQFDEIMSFKNLSTGKSFKVGDTIRVQCVKADVNSGNIDFHLCTEQ